MTHTTVLITDMAILVGIFLLGFLAKIFPKRGRNAGSKAVNHQPLTSRAKGPGQMNEMLNGINGLL
jgi:hypothetical protein